PRLGAALPRGTSRLLASSLFLLVDPSTSSIVRRASAPLASSSLHGQDTPPRQGRDARPSPQAAPGAERQEAVAARVRDAATHIPSGREAREAREEREAREGREAGEGRQEREEAAPPRVRTREQGRRGGEVRAHRLDAA